MAFIVEDAEGNRQEFDIRVRANEPNSTGKIQWLVCLQRLNGHIVENRGWRRAGPESRGRH